VWLDPPLGLEELAQHYTPDYYQLLQASSNDDHERWRRHAKSLQKYKRSGDILDLGCGSGAFLRALKADGVNWHLHGVEISPQSARQAAETTGAEVFVGDVLAAPFPPASFDAITAFDVLEHLHDPRETLRKITEWLRPGGIFYVFLPNIDSIERRVFRSYWFGLELPRHLYHFSPKSLRSLAERAGLQTTSISTTRDTVIENSLRYVARAVLGSFGIPREPLSRPARRQPPFVWRAARKGVRVGAFGLSAQLACLAGAGAFTRGVFTKGV